jgi:hypothetical protein
MCDKKNIFGDTRHPPEVSGLEEIQKEILTQAASEYLNNARHNENLRATAINMIIVVSAGIISVVTYDKCIGEKDYYLTGLMTVLGIIGCLFSVTHTERSKRYSTRAKFLSLELNNHFFNGTPPSGIEMIKKSADNYHSEKSRVKLAQNFGSNHIFWIILPFFILIIGLILTFLALAKEKCPEIINK